MKNISQVSKIFHRCGLVEFNGLNIVIDKRYSCLLPTHYVHNLLSKNKKYKLKNIRCITRKFYEELKRKDHSGKIVIEEFIIHVE